MGLQWRLCASSFQVFSPSQLPWGRQFPQAVSRIELKFFLLDKLAAQRVQEFNSISREESYLERGKKKEREKLDGYDTTVVN